MEITDFLLARIAEDENVAGAADALGQISDKITTSTCEEFADHIARHDPARVLAECEAKRRIVAEHQPEQYADAVDESFCATCRTGAFEREVSWPCVTIHALALPYADHPDYREEWRP